ncbi:MAG TPA: phosphatidate cytidylyltransferase [Desulfatiglandales bacterium]|nr:phosphatidate cytidylyltransferase [Desulfatiglandales bacterium]
MTSHAKRLITAFITLPLLVVIIYFAPFWVFIILIAVIALISLNEYYSMLKPNTAKKIILVNNLLTAALFLSILTNDSLFPAIYPFFVIFPLTFTVFSYPMDNLNIRDIGHIIMGPFYICLPLALLSIIAGFPDGQKWIFFILAVIFSGDTGSFYFGKLFGRHKLTKLSPGKTWEGAVGGLISNAVCASLFGYAAFPSLSRVTIMLLGIAIGISGQIGDLAESALKRISNVKDSGKILPGHGGMLDRIDSLLFAIPILYISLICMGVIVS